MADLDFAMLLPSGLLPPALTMVPQFLYDACSGSFLGAAIHYILHTEDGRGAYYAPAIFGSQPSGDFFWRPLAFEQSVLHMLQETGVLESWW